MENYLHYDQWLSDVLQYEVYRLDLSNEFVKKSKTNHQVFSSTISTKKVFIYARVRVYDNAAIKFLGNLGFYLVDTNIVFEKPLDFSSQSVGAFEVRFAIPEDRQGVRNLAADSFSCSRFHLDPLLPDDKANEIKASWAENFFFGNRGNSMVVASLDGKIVGFLQLLHSGKDLLIDLIGVDGNHRRKGIASDMIGFAQRSLKGFKRVRVGTQLANMPSIRMYENLKFMLIDASYVFHYHNS